MQPRLQGLSLSSPESPRVALESRKTWRFFVPRWSTFPATDEQPFPPSTRHTFDLLGCFFLILIGNYWSYRFDKCSEDEANFPPDFPRDFPHHHHQRTLPTRWLHKENVARHTLCIKSLICHRLWLNVVQRGLLLLSSAATTFFVSLELCNKNSPGSFIVCRELLNLECVKTMKRKTVIVCGATNSFRKGFAFFPPSLLFCMRGWWHFVCARRNAERKWLFSNQQSPRSVKTLQVVAAKEFPPLETNISAQLWTPPNTRATLRSSVDKVGV